MPESFFSDLVDAFHHHYYYYYYYYCSGLQGKKLAKLWLFPSEKAPSELCCSLTGTLMQVSHNTKPQTLTQNPDRDPNPISRNRLSLGTATPLKAPRYVLGWVKRGSITSTTSTRISYTIRRYHAALSPRNHWATHLRTSDHARHCTSR